MFRVLTISREYGSGGVRIGQGIAEKLEWKLLDKAFIDNIARAAKVDLQLAQRFDKRTDSWLTRLGRQGLWIGALEGGAVISQKNLFDAETMAVLSQKTIEEAYREGSCVIVGRGGQCVLHNRKDVFHAFIYGPWAQKLKEVRRRVPEKEDIEEVIRSMDRQRADYIRRYFRCNWMDPHLYHLMMCSALGENTVQSIIIGALASEGKQCGPAAQVPA